MSRTSRNGTGTRSRSPRSRPGPCGWDRDDELSRGPSAGARRRMKPRWSKFEPRRRMVVKSVGGPFVWRAVIEFGEISGGTSIDRTCAFDRPRGLYGGMSPVLPTLMRKEFQRDLDNLKRLMESGGL